MANIKFRECLKNKKRHGFLLAYDPTTKPAMQAIAHFRMLKIPYFINNDGAFIHKSNLVKNWLKRFIIHGASLCFASGESSADYFRAFGAKDNAIRYHHFTSLTKEDILLQPIGQTEKKSLRLKLGLDQEGIYVITVGQFIYRKGFDLLLRAWTDVEFKCNDAHLIIIGGGEKQTEYNSFIEDNGLSHVTILDFLRKEELFQYYKASDIFVLPTREDTWGLVINEAMACGLPVISSNMSIAARELITPNENGYLYSPDDIGALSDYLKNMLINPPLMKEVSLRNIQKIQGNTMENIEKKHIKDISEFFDRC